MTPLPFAGQLTEKDYGRVQSLAGRKIFLVLTVLIALLLLYLLYQWGWDCIVTHPREALTTFGPLVLVLPLGRAVRPFFLRRQWRSNKLMQRPIQGVVSSDGITWDIEGLSSTRYPWELLLRYRESPLLILVYQGLNQVLYFFPHYFANVAAWEAFREALRSRLPKK